MSLDIWNELQVWCAITKMSPGYVCHMALNNRRAGLSIRRGGITVKNAKKLHAWLVAHPAKTYGEKKWQGKKPGRKPEPEAPLERVQSMRR